MFEISLVWSVMPTLARGALLTIELTLLVILIGSAIALPLAVCKNARTPWPRRCAGVYVMFFRGTPALLQIFLLYYGAAQFDAIRQSVLWPVLRDPFWCVVIALGLNSAAYTGKTLASALSAVSKALREAAFVLGLGRGRTFWFIELPLAARTALPAFGNEVILTCKATSLASTVTLMELTGTARFVTAETYAPFEIFVSSGILYLALNYALAVGMRKLEAHLQHAR